MSEGSIVFQSFVNGVMLALLLILFALGLSLVFGIMRIIAFAHGELYMLGGFGIFTLHAQRDVNYILALVLTMAAVALIGIVIERYFYKSFRGKLISGLIVAVGLMLVMRASVGAGYGFLDQTVNGPSTFQGIVSFLGVTLSKERLFTILIAAILVLLLHFFMQRTKPGKAMRATAQAPQGAALLGVKVDNTCSLAMAIGSALAAAGGCLAGSLFVVHPYMGEAWLFKGIAAIVLGGLGSLPGTIVGGFVIGMVESYGSTYVGADYALMMVFLVLLAMLIIRPTGLFGLPARH